MSEAHFQDSSYPIEREKSTYGTDSKEEGERCGAAKHVL
jgi:hypothetical protein